MIFDMFNCGGCRTCEIACSYHHIGEFKPSISSIKISNKENEPGFRVTIVEVNDKKSIACDGCADLKEPLCIEVCEKKEDLERIINEYIKTMKSKKMPI